VDDGAAFEHQAGVAEIAKVATGPRLEQAQQVRREHIAQVKTEIEAQGIVFGFKLELFESKLWPRVGHENRGSLLANALEARREVALALKVGAQMIFGLIKRD